MLERAGVVHRIVTADDFARYELAEDLTEHHHHLICSACGDVRDFTVSPELEGDLDRALAAASARAHGFSRRPPPARPRGDLRGLRLTRQA